MITEMIKKVRESDVNKLIFTLFCLLIATDLSIFLNIPILREVLGVAFFSTVPGLLILSIFQLHKIKFLKKIVLTLALSIAFLMFLGLGINFIYLANIKPFSLVPLLVSLNLTMIGLMLISLKKNKDLAFHQLFNWEMNFENKSISLAIFPIMLPVLAIIGTFLMNKMEYNIIILIMLFLIPFYMVFLLIFKNKTHPSTYPLAIWLISLSLLLLNGLTSNHIFGIDVHHEYTVFNITFSQAFWDVVNNASNAYYLCTSITILPTIYAVLSNINGEYIFKIIYAFIGSLVPLVAYLTFNKYFKNDKAFLAALLIVFQNFFILSLGCTRQLVALLFFFLAVFILFDEEMSDKCRKILLILSIWTVIISHYSTAYVALALLLPIILLPFLKSMMSYLKNIKNKRINFKNFDIMVLIFAFMLVWYGVFAGIQVDAGSGSVEQISSSTASGITADSRDASVLAIFGIGVKSIPNLMSIIANDLIFLAIFIGLLGITIKFKYYREKMDFGFILGIYLFILLLIMFIIVPMVSKLFGAPRIFLQSLIFLAPAFIIGMDEVANLLRKVNLSYVLLFVLLVSLFSCSTYLQYYFYGTPYSPHYDSNGKLRGEYFIYDQEITGAQWLNNSKIDQKIYTDGIGHQRLMLGGIRFNNISQQLFLDNKTIPKGYIYEWNVNIKKGIVYTQLEEEENITNFRNLFTGKFIIYDNGYSRIWE